jgi:hypothetical protein
MTFLYGWAPPLPRLLHYAIFLPAPTWELLLVGKQCDKTGPVKITSIQVDITFIVPMLIDGVPSYAKGAQWLR